MMEKKIGALICLLYKLIVLVIVCLLICVSCIEM